MAEISKPSEYIQKRTARSLNLVQCLDHLAEDGLDIAHTKNGGDDAPLVVVVDEQLGLGMVSIQSLLDSGLVIFRPLIQLAAAGIALSGNLRSRRTCTSFCLGHGPWEAVQHPAAQNVVIGQAISEGKSSIFWPFEISEPSLIK
jgi:hypothetical protein